MLHAERTKRETKQSLHKLLYSLQTLLCVYNVFFSFFFLDKRLMLFELHQKEVKKKLVKKTNKIVRRKSF